MDKSVINLRGRDGNIDYARAVVGNTSPEAFDIILNYRGRYRMSVCCGMDFNAVCSQLEEIGAKITAEVYEDDDGVRFEYQASLPYKNRGGMA